MTFGFIIIRHVNHRISDMYWKESYRCIRRWYPETPIMIIDDNSNPAFLTEDLITTRCTVVYDKFNQGRAELLPYYYFHRIRPFDTAVVIHDSVFLQGRIPMLDDESNQGITFLWSITHAFDYTIEKELNEMLTGLPEEESLRALYAQKDKWYGGFGVMSVIQWSFLDRMNTRYQLFDQFIPKLKNREYRSALERLFGLLAHHMMDNSDKKKTCYGDIHSYLRWGVSYIDYLIDETLTDPSRYPIMKVWSGR